MHGLEGFPGHFDLKEFLVGELLFRANHLENELVPFQRQRNTRLHIAVLDAIRLCNLGVSLFDYCRKVFPCLLVQRVPFCPAASSDHERKANGQRHGG